MKFGNLNKIGTTFLLTPALLAATIPAGAQELHRRGGDDDRGRYQQPYDQRSYRGGYDRGYDRHDYDRHDYDRHDYDRHDYRGYDRDRYRGGNGYYGAPAGYVTYGNGYRGGDYGYVQDNGIGPGKGAAIGAVGGAVLGAIVGGGKGAVIGGAAGAGVGAIAGQAAQDHRYNQYGY